MNECVFCKCDPYHYEDVGVGYVAVAVNCCETMCALVNDDKKAKQILRLRRRGTPRSVKRANQIWYDVFYEGPIADKEQLRARQLSG